jgi:hypothetical protein
MEMNERQSPLQVISWVIFHHPLGQNALDIPPVICFYAKKGHCCKKQRKLRIKKPQ